MQFSKCRRERQVGTKSCFLNSFNPKRQCSPSHLSTRSRGLGRNGHQRLYPKHCPQPFLTHSPVLVSPAEAKAVPHSQPGGPCSHSFRSGCLQHANHFQTFYEQQTGMNSLFHWGERKNPLHWPVLFQKGWVFWIFAAVLRETNGLSMDKVVKGVWYRHLSCAHL